MDIQHGDHFNMGPEHSITLQVVKLRPDVGLDLGSCGIGYTEVIAIVLSDSPLNWQVAFGGGVAGTTKAAYTLPSIEGRSCIESGAVLRSRPSPIRKM
jgi:hypothetical protein